MDFYVTGSGHEEKLILSECFSHDQAIENYQLFLGYFTNRREYKFEDIPTAFVVLAKDVRALLDFHYMPEKVPIDRSIFKRYETATDMCQQLQGINDFRKTNPFYQRTTATERAYLNLFVDVLIKWIPDVFRMKR